MTLKLFKKYMITDQKCTYNTFAFVLESNMKVKYLQNTTYLGNSNMDFFVQLVYNFFHKRHHLSRPRPKSMTTYLALLTKIIDQTKTKVSIEAKYVVE